jgi:hypothetical protein
MSSRRLLVAASTAQLAAQFAGLAVALRRRRYYDVGFMRGSPEHVARDALWAGTAYSAPAFMLAGQLWAIRRLSAGPDDLARGVLWLRGAIDVPGFLGERWGRERLRPRGWDPVETPPLAAALVLAVAMLVAAHRPADQSGVRP